MPQQDGSREESETALYKKCGFATDWHKESTEKKLGQFPRIIEIFNVACVQ